MSKIRKVKFTSASTNQNVNALSHSDIRAHITNKRKHLWRFTEALKNRVICNTVRMEIMNINQATTIYRVILVFNGKISNKSRKKQVCNK